MTRLLLRCLFGTALLLTVSDHENTSVLAQDTNLGNDSQPFVIESPPYRGLDANLYMQTSAEYRAVCYQTFVLAELRLRQAITTSPKDSRKMVVVMDLDETVVDNGGFQTWMLRNGRAYDQSMFDRWEEFGGDQVSLIPGAKEFILTAESLGVTVVHISNRNDRFREQTKRTLTRLGIPIHHDRELKLSTATSDKTSRRREVEQEDKCRILLYVGDNLRDFDESFRSPQLTPDSTPADLAQAIAARKKRVDATKANWGNKWIVIPNPAYGEWLKPLARGLRDIGHLAHVGESLGFAFWNVENLFDTIDDPNVEGDEEFTPNGVYHWTPERLEIKLSNLARVVTCMDDGRGPAVLGLAEIENRRVVQLLVDKLKSLGRDYQIVHHDSPSGRGIDCALIYDAEEFELESQQFHLVDAEDTRDILEAKLSKNGSSLTVFVNHWPARSHDESFRMIAAKTLLARLRKILRDDPLADVLMMGDFNDHPNDKSLVDGLGAVADIKSLTNGKVFNTSFAAEPDSSTGTYVYNETWEILDQVLVSPGMLLPGGVSWGLGSTRPVVLADDQMFHPTGQGIAKPSRSYTRTTFHSNGYSDHMPIVTEIFW